MKELASGAAVAIAVFGTGPYVVGMLRGRIRPHAFTWLVWTVTTMIAFAGQLVGNGGIGAAAAGASALVGVAISGYAFWRGGALLHGTRLAMSCRRCYRTRRLGICRRPAYRCHSDRARRCDWGGADDPQGVCEAGRRRNLTVCAGQLQVAACDLRTRSPEPADTSLPRDNHRREHRDHHRRARSPCAASIAADRRSHGLAPRAPPRHGRRIAWATVRGMSPRTSAPGSRVTEWRQ